MEIPVLLLKTILLRPYVFIFLAAFLFAGVITMGLRRTLVFWFGTWVLAFLSEFSSTRNGFPYGLYHYTGSTRGQELFISNVPFMDSLSYSFLLYAAYSVALFWVSPIRVSGFDVQVADTFSIRKSKRALFLTAVLMMMIDVIIDPIALKGDQWFLGRIYYYEYEGFYFGIPLSNAAGWGLVGFVATWVYQQIESRWLGPTFRDRGLRVWKFRGIYGPGLYFGVLLFNLAITIWIGEKGLFVAGCFIFLIPTVLLALRLIDLRARATDADWKTHLAEFQVTKT